MSDKKKKPVARITWDPDFMGNPAVRVDTDGGLAKAFGMIAPEPRYIKEMLDYFWELQEQGYELKF